MEDLQSVSRSVSEGLNSFIRNSMEDSDTSATRKRPRLDSGETISQTMSTEKPVASPIYSIENEQSLPATEEVITLSAVDPGTKTDQSLLQSPSKMTINFRDRSLYSTSPTKSPAPTGTSSPRRSSHFASTSSASDMPSTSPPRAASSSSPSRSPEIEVAELEEFDDDPRNTRWKTLHETNAIEVLDELLSTFPGVAQYRSAPAAISQLNAMLERGIFIDRCIMHSLSKWIKVFLSRTATLGSIWWDQVTEYRQFWDSLALTMSNFLRHSIKTKEDYVQIVSTESNDPGSKSNIQDFLCSYVTLAGRMLEVDCQTLKQTAREFSGTPDLVSTVYVQQLQWVGYAPGDSPLFRSLQAFDDSEPARTITTTIDAFCSAPVRGLEHIAQFVELLFDRFNTEPSLLPFAWNAMRVVQVICNFLLALPKLRRENLKASSALVAFIAHEGIKFYRILDAKLDGTTGKQAITLPQEVSKTFLQELGNILQRIAELSEDVRIAYLPADFVSRSDMSTDEQSDLIHLAWRYQWFHKWIKQGRMELRVQGVEMMQNLLVLVYNRYIQNRRSEPLHDIAQYFASRILQDKMVNYLVGVESHPQLISQSGNIVGFLIVTDHFTHTESDTIWKSVASTQDTHTVEAILEMMQGIFNITGYSVLLQFCESLSRMPVRAFDAKMLTYSTSLLEHLRNKFRPDSSHPRLDLVPYHLCVKLLRHATVEPTLSPGRRREICYLAHSEMQALMSLGLADEDSDTIIRGCVVEISSKSSLATGAIAAINALVQIDPRNRMKDLSSSFNIVPLAIDEICLFLEKHVVDMMTLELYDDALNHRLILLEHIVLQVPDAFDAETASTLWNSLMGPNLPSDQARDLIWHRLGKILSCCMVENTFMSCCIREYMPSVDPQCLTPGVIPFSQQVLCYYERIHNSPTGETIETHHAASKELLWHVALSVNKQSLANDAIRLLVTLYSDCSSILQGLTSKPKTSHVILVERCILQLLKATDGLQKLNDGTSSGEDDSMVIVASEKEVQAHQFRFLRSLNVLKELTQRIRSQTIQSPSPELASEDLRPLRGKKVRIHYQAFSGGADKRQRSLEIGDLETFDVLMSRLALLTGFSKFTAIAGGQRLDAESSKTLTLREMKLDQRGQLLLRKALDAEPLSGTPTNQGLRPLEAEIVKHFDQLYGLLGIDEELGKEVFDFLTTFPPSNNVLRDVSSEQVSLIELFPPENPYKSLYSVYALKSCLARHFDDGEARRTYVLHGLRTLLDALEVLGSSRLVRTNLISAQGLVECLLIFLKEPVAQDLSDHTFVNCSRLVDRIQSLISTAQLNLKDFESDVLVCDSFALMLECSLHSTDFWESFSNHERTSMLLQYLTLDSRSTNVRNAAITSIRTVCGVLPTPAKVTRESFVLFFWNFCLGTIERTLHLTQRTEQFYEIALEVFRLRGNIGYEALPVIDYVHSWSTMLNDRGHEEFVGRESVDWVKFGLAGLIDWGIRLLKAKKQPFSINHDLIQSLFSKHLFPQIPSTGSKVTASTSPVLHSATRGRLYSILLALSNDMESFDKLSALVLDLLSPGEDSQAWSWGCAQLIEDYAFEPNWNFERLKAIRSPTGYPGLRNLSNTCYLNSLFTQLFMNIGFREFIFGIALDDIERNQRQLLETKRLFAYMQESWLKCVDPHGIAELGIQEEDVPIDVSIQMDVDEFYNLLFSKWESQISSKETARSLNAFYGGQIVQQIYAKPCDHVSERLEQFSAIQLEIQGKATLAESLAAYIGGEAMEGDNQYACERCGSKRDAMKRACLKDIPDSLIFHLKRFSYDIATGMRNKVNDRFEFPDAIDMSPYTIEHLMYPEEPSVPDNYRLVGVLVHSGNAESGHYYSYIREHPVNPAQSEVWLEFNDADVSRFDPANIPEQCFGGWSDHTLPNMRYLKQWNAYMLFYQRTKRMDEDFQRYSPVPMDRPVKATVPTVLHSAVSLDNDAWIRRYCMFDPEHMGFVKSLLSQLRVINKGFCTDTHILEKRTIELSLEHLNQVFSRSKGCEEFDAILKLLKDSGKRCSKCCHAILDTVTTREPILRNLLLRNPDPQARAKFSGFILECLKSLRLTNRVLYGLEEPMTDVISPSENFPNISGAFQAMVKALWMMRVFIHQNNRSWDDYFGLLQNLANLGDSECQHMLDLGFLRHCLELLIADQPFGKRVRLENPHLQSYYRLVEKGRKFSLRYAIALLERLMDLVDLTLQPCDVDESRPVSDTGSPRSLYEDGLLRAASDATKENSLLVLEKVISQATNPGVIQGFLRKLLCAEPEFGAYEEIQNTILTGINLEPAYLTDPYLNAILTVCEFGPQPSDAKIMIRRVAREVDSIGIYGGAEHLAFFARVRRIRNARVNISATFFHRTVLELVPYWAPTLLMYADPQVRKETINLLHTMVFNHDVQAMDDEQRADEIEKAGRSLCDACLRRFQEQFIAPGKAIDVKTVEDSVEVIRHCLETYYDPHDTADREARIRAEGVLDELHSLTVTTPEDEYSGADYDSDALSAFSCNSA